MSESSESSSSWHSHDNAEVAKDLEPKRLTTMKEVTSQDSLDFEAAVLAASPRLRGRKLTAALAFVAGTGFTLFGYDQGVMSALLTAKQEIGCLIGALSNLWIGDRLGRRKTIMLGGVVMTIGAILQTTSFSYSQLVVARIITGLGNGLNVRTNASKLLVSVAHLQTNF
ncbi:hypothetical protein PHLCEN_2v12317 [Hermanssonia centrifuga]|uniref:Major facilitator superfamily (MFS) profile domain-containing protein n=1 Tax=Hermanssonia centrifuga TaxID=98765 RepID=A0A2R6NHE8_9APHY|nr:hypothetical protein PHLCEN_2v12317 [Hermanssonia centrifuga]